MRCMAGRWQLLRQIASVVCAPLPLPPWRAAARVWPALLRSPSDVLKHQQRSHWLSAELQET